MASYKLSQEAEEDLIRIHQTGIREFGEAQADKYYFAFIKRFEKIAEQPYLYQGVDDIREGYRRSVCGVDSNYYRIINNTVEIMAMFGNQNTDQWL